MKGITGIILAGGKSSRMGADKAMLEWKGKKMIQYVIDALHPNVEELIIISNDSKHQSLGYKVYEDSVKDCGPLGGIYTALQKSTNEKIFVLSCDLPKITSEVIEFMISKMQNEEALVPVNNDKIEPLCAIYDKAALSKIKQCLDAGEYKIRNAIDKLESRYLDVNLHLNLFAGVFSNVNNPKDLDQLK